MQQQVWKVRSCWVVTPFSSERADDMEEHASILREEELAIGW
jgi:hypothetical protein